METFAFVRFIRKTALVVFRKFERFCEPLAPLYHRLLDNSRRGDYVIAAALGLVPALAALACGVFFDVLPSAETLRALGCVGAPKPFAGIVSRYNWLLLYIAILPIALWCVRHVARRLFCLGTGQQCAIVSVIPPPMRSVVTAEINIAATRPSVLGVVALLALVLNVIDVGEVLQSYASYAMGTPTCPREQDWSVMFLLQEAPTGVWRNVLFVCIAYTLQWLAITLGFLIFGLCLVHNVLYLRLVYQRRHAHDPAEAIVLDLADVNNRFGQRAMHAVFDWQIAYLLVAGLAICVSRYANVEADTGALWAHLIEAVSDLKFAKARAAFGALFTYTTGKALFPDVGQVELLIGYAFCALCIVIPSFVKFLPYGTASNLTDYLGEFVPPSGSDPDAEKQELARLAPRFAANAFWPAGDGLAKWLFGMVFFVFAAILIPIPGEPVQALIISTGVVIATAFLLTKLLFWVYAQALRVVDSRLVEPKQ
ncbi:MAG TPA: hypothetical protein VNA69_18285 [Thermoanaerobaculia bacterium]|nr:hypothetical protein [Thermoanaerobaculia bacterium]